jgi:hypothetical protein
MTLTPAPPLDARTFDELVEAGRRRITSLAPEWTDLSPSDPGIVLLEVFAYLTEGLLYRLNRLPDTAYDSFLRLLGVNRQPQSAATVKLTFTRAAPADAVRAIPRGTRVTVARAASAGETPVFVIAAGGTMAPGDLSLELTANHAEPIDGEAAGTGTGLPGQVVRARRGPIVESSTGDLPLIVATELKAGDASSGVETIDFNGVAHRVWREVPDFSELGDERFVYVADRATGTVTFAPAIRITLDDGTLAEQPSALGEAPPLGRTIRLWYWVGGGPSGNVAENTLTVLKDPIPGVQVTNKTRATGGRAAETIEQARLRGPVEFRRLERAVTARDFEDLASRSSAIARSLAVTKVELWAHAAPGTVQVIIVPSVPDLLARQYRLSPAELAGYETEAARAGVQQTLDERRPLGTRCEVSWVNVKTVTVRARVVIHRNADRDSIARQVLDRLYQTIIPVQTPLQPEGWGFGHPLRSWDVNLIVEAVAGVQYADSVQLLVDSAPDADVASLVPAVQQPRMWFTASGDTLFRTSDDGDGWELVARVPGEQIQLVRPHPLRPGLLAIISQTADDGPSQVRISADAAESMGTKAVSPGTHVYDAAWIERFGKPLLLLATDAGLREMAPEEGAQVGSVAVTGANPEPGIFAVTAAIDALGNVRVAVAARDGGGVHLSDAGGQSGTFRLVGMQGKDVRRLVVQEPGGHAYLWAGITAAGFETGVGAYRVDLTAAVTPEAWQLVGDNWSVLNAGSCRAIAFRGRQVLAATERRGVLWLNLDAPTPQWTAADVRNGLPLQEDGHPFPIRTLAVSPEDVGSAQPSGIIVAGGDRGVYRTRDPGAPYENVSARELSSKVTLPSTWLFCSGSHQVDVVYDDARR